GPADKSCFRPSRSVTSATRPRAASSSRMCMARRLPDRAPKSGVRFDLKSGVRFDFRDHGWSREHRCPRRALLLECGGDGVEACECCAASLVVTKRQTQRSSERELHGADCNEALELSRIAQQAPR